MNIYNSIMQGLTEAVQYEKGELKVNTSKISVAPLPVIQSKEIRSIRLSLDMTQSVFAQIMGVSVKTVEAWEGGRSTPNGTARRMLSMLRSDPKLPEKCGLLAR
ncbi:helix-turn-helix domain-containing protein [Huintestinicola sp.]|uniref:helix-turn-helix domain-containing protein n=1 Tax=Huintestinicola sp. TaxID=2981661 RepID=UPI003D7C3710